MMNDITKKIFVAYDNLECKMICAAASMGDTVRRVFNYMHANDFTCTGFNYDEFFTIIDYLDTFRIGPDITERHGLIIIDEAPFFKSDE